jgi:hypothetical protein
VIPHQDEVDPSFHEEEEEEAAAFQEEVLPDEVVELLDLEQEHLRPVELILEPAEEVPTPLGVQLKPLITSLLTVYYGNFPACFFQANSSLNKAAAGRFGVGQARYLTKLNRKESKIVKKATFVVIFF